jgi:hypothetical protein
MTVCGQTGETEFWCDVFISRDLKVADRPLAPAER